MNSNIKFHENPSSGSRGVPDGRTDMTKLIVTIRDFAKVTKNSVYASNHKKVKMWIMLLLKQVTSSLTAAVSQPKNCPQELDYDWYDNYFPQYRYTC